MYGAVLPDLIAARRADLLHEAAYARRVAAARRRWVIPSTTWRWRPRPGIQGHPSALHARAATTTARGSHPQAVEPAG